MSIMGRNGDQDLPNLNGDLSLYVIFVLQKCPLNEMVG